MLREDGVNEANNGTCTVTRFRERSESGFKIERTEEDGGGKAIACQKN